MTAPNAGAAEAPGNKSETSLIARFVAFLTPVFAVLAGWLAGWAATAWPGLHLDPAQIVTFMTAVAVAALTAAWKWLHGWQQHERLVAAGRTKPAAEQRKIRKAARSATTPGLRRKLAGVFTRSPLPQSVSASAQSAGR